MSKYFMAWEVNESLVPLDPKERGALVVKLVEMTKQGMDAGMTTDWGIFLSGNKGYSIGNGSALQLYQKLQMFSPHIRFEVQEVLSIDDLEKTFKAMMG